MPGALENFSPTGCTAVWGSTPGNKKNKKIHKQTNPFILYPCHHEHSARFSSVFWSFTQLCTCVKQESSDFKHLKTTNKVTVSQIGNRAPEKQAGTHRPTSSSPAPPGQQLSKCGPGPTEASSPGNVFDITYMWTLKKRIQSFHYGTAETNPTSIHEDVDSIPGLDQWVKDLALP